GVALAGGQCSIGSQLMARWRSRISYQPVFQLVIVRPAVGPFRERSPAVPYFDGLVVGTIRRSHFPHEDPFLSQLAIVNVTAVGAIGIMIPGEQLVSPFIGIQIVSSTTLFHFGELIVGHVVDLTPLL